MNNIDKVIETFVSGDYFILFLVLTLAILVVLILALIKSRGEYNELLNYELDRKKRKDNGEVEVIEDEDDGSDILEDFKALLADSKDDVIDENKPLIKQIDVPNVKTYVDEIDDYETSEEENAVISAEELEKRAKERLDALGTNDNQEAIAKYEEEQEKKAIISYEQLLKNASNITLSYKEESSKDKDAPKINKIEAHQKEVTGTENYLEEEEFLKILKSFRESLNENIYN